MQTLSDKKTSIAVLPFKNISSDKENEHFCDGITEEIIHALGKIDQLKVISRNSSFYFKDHEASVKEIGEKLDVNTLLEGSVRLGGDKLRISAHLIDVETDETYWSETWDRTREDIFEIQDDVSLAIAEVLREHLGHLDISDHLVTKPTESVNAYDHYLKGRFHFNAWNAEGAKTSIKEFQKAVDLDPNMIQGHLGLADAYSFLAVAGFAPKEESWMKATESIEVAKKINPNDAELNYMLANQYLFTEASYPKSLEYLLKSLAVDPTSPETHRITSFVYSLKGDFAKANEHIFYAKSVDPLNPETLFFEASCLYRMGEYERSKFILKGILEENDKNLPAVHLSLNIKILEGDIEGAKALLESTPQALFTPDERLGFLTLIDIKLGERSGDHLSELIEKANSPFAHHAHSYLFMSYSMLGEFEKAFDVLQNLFENHSSILLLGFSDPLASDIQKTEKYKRFHSKIYPDPKSQVSIEKSKAITIDDDTAEDYLKRLNDYIISEEPYLNPTLTLRLLADNLEIHPNQLSRLLNEKLGKNFNEFINQQRIEHFKHLVVDPANSHISLIGLAYESGFNSKTVFNTTFKKEVGMTPKEYQKSQLA